MLHIRALGTDLAYWRFLQSGEGKTLHMNPTRTAQNCARLPNHARDSVGPAFALPDGMTQLPYMSRLPGQFDIFVDRAKIGRKKANKIKRALQFMIGISLALGLGMTFLTFCVVFLIVLAIKLTEGE